MATARAVLVTGSAGWIGRAVCAELVARGHRVRGFDRAPSPALGDAVVGDVADPGSVAGALQGLDTVVHLAATPDEADFLTSLLPNNVVGLYHVLEAAREARLARVILVSSGQLYRGHDGPLPITSATPPAPRNWYALTKVLTEAAGQVYAHAHGLNVVVVRPGWVPRSPAHAAELAASAHGKDSYLSPGDAGRGFAAAVEAEGLPRYALVHVTSRPLRVARYDLEPARRLLGYEPRDRWPDGLGFAGGPAAGGRAVTDVSAGRAVVDCLKAEGIRHVFGIVGSTFLDVLDVLHDDRSVEYVNVRHEQGGAFMADGLARVTGRPAACLVTSGPGATNLVTGVAGAHLAHSPVVAIAGGSPLGVEGRDAFQELDLVALFRPVTKLSIQVTRPERIPEMLRLAFRTAMAGRKGPVFVDIPRDVLNDQAIRADVLAPDRYRPTHAPPPHPEAIRAAARLLARAERPLLLAGGGVTWAEATDLVARLVRRHALPSITAYGRNDAVSNDEPLYVGPLGRAGSPEAAQACRRADLLLVVGSRLGQFTSFYDARYVQPGTALVQVDVDGRDIGRVYPVAVGIQADARETLAALLDVLAEERVGQTPEAWQQEARELRARRHARLEADSALDAVPVKPQRVYAELRRALPPDTIVTLDAGAAPAYGYDRLHFTRPRTLLTPLDLGGLGFAFPAALGAKLGRPDAPALAIHGDGGFLMNAQELETAVRHGIAAVALVLNNNCWGSEKAYQRHFYDARYVGTDLSNPRYDRLAELFGARGYYAERPTLIGEMVRDALASGRPAVVEIPIDPDEFPVPATAARRRDG